MSRVQYMCGDPLRAMVSEFPWPAAMHRGRDLAIESANDAYRALFLQGHSRVRGRPLAEIASDSARLALGVVFERALQSGRPAAAPELRVCTRQGDLLSETAWTIVAIPTGGDGEGLLAVAVDVTDEVAARARLEAAVRDDVDRANERLAILAEAGQVLASSLDYDTTIANVVRLALPLLGDFGCVDLVDTGGRVRRIARAHNDRRRQAILSGTGAVPATPPDLHLSALSTGQPALHPSVDDAWYRRVAVDADHLQRMRDLAFRSMLTVPLQHQRRVLGALTLYFADSGRRYSSSDLALAEELARRAAVALENARLLREAREAVRHRDDFLSIASHELRTPLSALRLHAETMSRLVRRGAERAPERLAVKLDKIVAQVERLDGLLDSLLDVSHMVQGRLRMRLERIDLGEVVRDVVARFEEELDEAGCSVRLRAETSAAGLWDPLRLDQVVTNLLTNAIKYGKGGPIEIDVTGEAEAARLTVRDHGIGIPAQDQPRIFRRFERAASERHYGGLGLGLWITRRIVEALGGSIHVDSVPGQGATFTVELPR